MWNGRFLHEQVYDGGLLEHTYYGDDAYGNDVGHTEGQQQHGDDGSSQLSDDEM